MIPFPNEYSVQFRVFSSDQILSYTITRANLAGYMYKHFLKIVFV